MTYVPKSKRLEKTPEEPEPYYMRDRNLRMHETQEMLERLTKFANEVDEGMWVDNLMRHSKGISGVEPFSESTARHLWNKFKEYNSDILRLWSYLDGRSKKVMSSWLSEVLHVYKWGR